VIRHHSHPGLEFRLGLTCTQNLHGLASRHPAATGSGGPCAADWYRRFVTDCGMWLHLVVISSPSLAFSDGVVETHESMLGSGIPPGSAH
jgi:hypothetical protein